MRCGLVRGCPAVRSGAGLRVGAGGAVAGRVRWVAGGAGLWVAGGRSLAGSSIEMYVRRWVYEVLDKGTRTTL